LQNNLEKIQNLVNSFDLKIKDYTQTTYNEASVRVDFIDKFFEIFGWDVRNIKEALEEYREVVREDKLTIEGKPKAPDYSFRIGGKRIFFVEAKKPMIDVKHDIASAYQLRRYGYTAKLPISILTDFEEFAIYDTRIKPKPDDNASVARIFYCTYKEYEKNFEFFNKTLSKDGVLKGSLKQYIEDDNKKSGTSSVDKEFLNMIDEWRQNLAKNLSLRNESLNIHNINYAVQKIIDRIIFLRIAEDRGIENYNNLHNLAHLDKNENKENLVYKNLCESFEKADKKYNSGLFKQDKFLNNLTIDNKIFVEIIHSLYYPKCPYEFSILPVEMLGNIYEQFLGKTIRLTENHHAKIEEKPEVRKAGGVYYTPQYIVDYIVENTVGEKIKDRNPKEIENIKILDPSCGSGSFLLGAYKFLLDYHLKYYTDKENIKKALKDGKIYQTIENYYHLTIKEKQNILLNNIYGVDIDEQAVEVSKLSLLLKLMEGENLESAGNLFKHSDLKLLPSLDNNIKCGNSLIGSDFYDNAQMNLFDDEQIRKINAFDWEKEFVDIFKQGGFDVLIGNPPYVKIQVLQDTNPYIVKELKKRYISAQSGNYDIYIVFIEKGFALLNEKGVLGFINPNKFFNSNYGTNLRDMIIKNKSIKKIIHFNDIQIFENATTYTCLLFLQKQQNITFNAIKLSSKNYKPNLLNCELPFKSIITETWADKDWIIVSENNKNLLQKISNYSLLSTLTTNIFQGPKAGADNVFILKLKEQKEKTSIFYSHSLGTEVEIENNIVQKYIKGKHILRYKIDCSQNEYAIFPYRKDKLISAIDLKLIYPFTWEYFNNATNKKILIDREKGRFGKTFWQYSRPQNMNILYEEKILTPFNAFENSFALDDKKDFIFSAGVSGAYGILLKNNINISYQYLLGILNSKLVLFFIRNISTCLRGGFYSYENKYIKNIPIKLINFTNPLEKQQHDTLVSLVSQMLSTQTQFHEAKTESDKKVYKQKIDILDKQIDTIVYKLYDLTDYEIKIIENIEA
jgi:adenine-specific DNA-methyltransferase